MQGCRERGIQLDCALEVSDRFAVIGLGLLQLFPGFIQRGPRLSRRRQRISREDGTIGLDNTPQDERRDDRLIETPTGSQSDSVRAMPGQRRAQLAAAQIETSEVFAVNRL